MRASPSPCHSQSPAITPRIRNSQNFVRTRLCTSKLLTGQDRVYTSIEGFGNSSDDYKIRIENTNVKAGMTITGDRPLAKMALWSIRSVLAVEPFVDISVEPGSQSTWKYAL